MRILLLQDDDQVADDLRRRLEEEDYSVTVCHDAAAALRAVRSEHFNILLLEAMTPFLDGCELTRRVRQEENHTPILLLATSDAADDTVRGFDAGADDYLVKPFSFKVLLARLKARTRLPPANHVRLRAGDLTMDLEAREVRRGNVAVSLTRTEFSLLECLVRNAGRVVTRDSLIESAWGRKNVSFNNLEAFINFLRNKVDLPGHHKLIQTERGVGYSLKEQVCLSGDSDLQLANESSH